MRRGKNLCFGIINYGKGGRQEPGRVQVGWKTGRYQIVVLDDLCVLELLQCGGRRVPTVDGG